MAGASNGQYSRFLSFHGRNPDVLNSIANLSNDEVFTPPEFANRMLDTLERAWAESHDGEILWQNSTLKFLDPFTKSGVFLREIATRLIKGLEDEIPDLQARVDHILTQQVYGIATTKLTSLMARRSLYCSKKANGKHSVTKKFNNEDGNIWFQPTKHEWVGGKTKIITADKDGNEIEKTVDGKCKFCGASKRDFDREEGLELHAYGLIHNDDPKKWVSEVFGEEMQFDVIIGNPPYQLDDGGHGVSAAPIYHLFVEQAIRLDPRYVCMVTPSRWFAGGKGLNAFRERMIADERISHLVDFFDSSAVFPGVSIRGGVSFFLWDSLHSGAAEIESVIAGVSSKSVRKLLEPHMDIFVRLNPGLQILRRVIEKQSNSATDFLSDSDAQNLRLSSIVSSRKPFGIPTNYQGPSIGNPGDLLVYQNGGKGYIDPHSLTKGQELVSAWKIFVGYASTGDEFPNSVLAKPFLGKPGEICSETYLAIGPFEDEEQAKNCLTYMTTKFFRFMVLLRKSSQHVTQSVYGFVPLLDLSRPWLDEQLYEYFELSQQDIDLIEELIRPMRLIHD